jgi:Arc/MetJ family transcription regulator
VSRWKDVDVRIDGDLTAYAVQEITRRLALAVERAAYKLALSTCVADGCLVRNYETCPACRVRVLQRKGVL